MGFPVHEVMSYLDFAHVLSSRIMELQWNVSEIWKEEK